MRGRTAPRRPRVHSAGRRRARHPAGMDIGVEKAGRLRARGLARRLLQSRRMNPLLLEGTLLGLVAALGLTAWRLRRGRV